MLGNLAAWVTGALDNVFDHPQDDSEFENGLIDLQCGRTVFNDVPSSMRTELWASQLHKLRSSGSAAVAKYSSLASSPLTPDVVAEIEKDTHRTFPSHPWLRGRAGQLAMLRVLRAYAVFDPEVGYTQGMNFLAGLFLAYLDEPQAFGALVLVMQDRGLRALYLPNDGMALLQVRLWQLGRLMPPRLSTHLENHAALPVLYASSWFLTCFSAEFSMHFAARVMDLVVTDHYAAPFMKVAVHILERCEEELLKMEDLEEMIDYLRKDVPKWPRGKLQDLLTEALGRGWTARQSEVLKEINGAESVADAVARVDLALAAGGGGGGDPPEIGKDGDSGNVNKEEITVDNNNNNNSRVNKIAVENTKAEAEATTPVKMTLPILPPPPTSKNDKVEWAKWRPTTPILNTMDTENIKIQTELSEIALDPGLSRELSTYLSKNDASNWPSAAEADAGGESNTAKVTTEMSLKVSSPASASHNLHTVTENVAAVTSPVTTDTRRSASGGGGANRKPSPAIPSPFESRSPASSSIGTHGTHSTFEHSLSANIGEFSDFAGASDNVSGDAGAEKKTVSGVGGGAKEQMMSWGQSTADSITYLLANFSMGINTSDSALPGDGSSIGVHNHEKKKRGEIKLDPTHLMLQARESIAESSGMLPTPQMSGFGSWRVADPSDAETSKQESNAGGTAVAQKDKAVAGAGAGEEMITSASSSV